MVAYRRFRGAPINCKLILLGLGLYSFLASPSAFSTTASAENSASSQQTSSAHLNYEVHEEKSEDDHQPNFLPSMDQLFENPAVVSGLQSATNAINRSVESLMDSLFYSLLDNSFRYPITGEFSVSLNTERNVFSTDRGAYVVVDRIFFGPEYQTTIGHIHDVPIHLGATSYVNILDIYLRTDAARLSDKEELAFWRYGLNQWFGLLPALTQFLPPLFNPNQLYDPLRLAETPFVFPLNKERFYAMPLGTIRSYSLTGGISLPFDLAGFTSTGIQKILNTFQIKAGLPYTVFVQGEHRINVLRKDHHIAWVGLSRTQKVGHSIAGILGNTFYLLAGAIRPIPWKGFPVSFAPIDFELSQADIDRFELLYAFDLATTKGASAYEQAAKGNFVPAHELALEQNEKPSAIYHFSKESEGLENSDSTVNSYFVHRIQRSKKSETAEIKIDDSQGTFYMLEGHQQTKDSHSNLLLGAEEISLASQMELEVNRQSMVEDLQDPQEKKGFIYTFKSPTPYHLDVTIQIKDRLVNIEEYHAYIDKIKALTRLECEGLPRFPLRSEEELRSYRRRAYLHNPAQAALSIHVPATSLGKFHATASLHFDTLALQDIWQKPAADKWQAFGKAFGLSIAESQEFSDPSFFLTFTQTSKKWLLSPLRLFHFYFPKVDAFTEIHQQISTLNDMAKHSTPLELLQTYEHLFTTTHGDKLLEALLNLSDLQQIPRRVSFFVHPATGLEAGIKTQLQALNGKSFSSEKPFPKPHRYSVTQDKLNAFTPSLLTDPRQKPQLSHITIDLVSVKNIATGLDERVLKVGLTGKHGHTRGKTKIYARFETGGKLELGKYIISEGIIELAPITGDTKSLPNLDTYSYQFFLTGQESQLNQSVMENFFELKGDFILHIAISEDCNLWSHEQSLSFRIEGDSLQLLTP